MNSWNASPGELWYDEDAHGPRRVTRTCSGCGRKFRMVVEGEYVLHVVCDRCAAESQSKERYANHQSD